MYGIGQTVGPKGCGRLIVLGDGAFRQERIAGRELITVWQDRLPAASLFPSPSPRPSPPAGARATKEAAPVLLRKNLPQKALAKGEEQCGQSLAQEERGETGAERRLRS